MRMSKYKIEVIYSRLKKYEGRKITISKERWMKCTHKIKNFFISLTENRKGFKFYMLDKDNVQIVLALLLTETE